MFDNIILSLFEIFIKWVVCPMVILALLYVPVWFIKDIIDEAKRERQEKNAVDPFDEIIKNLENIDRNVRELADNIKEQPAEPKGK